MNQLVLALLLTFCISAYADECREQSLIHFLSGGQEVGSEVIGKGDPCDHFGGNLVHTPKSNIFLYVNFNIAGTIDLDAVDAALAKAPPSGKVHDWLLSVQLAVVDKGWIKRMYNDDREAILNLSGDSFFVSETVVNEGRFEAVMADFYGAANR